jgi:hypothetical protein
LIVRPAFASLLLTSLLIAIATPLAFAQSVVHYATTSANVKYLFATA